jgi:hypothetical protein
LLNGAHVFNRDTRRTKQEVKQRTKAVGYGWHRGADHIYIWAAFQ